MMDKKDIQQVNKVSESFKRVGEAFGKFALAISNTQPSVEGWNKAIRDLNKKVGIVYTCSDCVHHEHKWRWVTWLCGKYQWIRDFIKGV